MDDHKNRFGVEPICRVLTEHGCKVAPSTYYAFKARPASRRAIRDAELRITIDEVFHDRQKGRSVSGVRKVWRLLKRDGVDVARCTPDLCRWLASLSLAANLELPAVPGR